MKVWRILGALAISALLLWVTFRHVDFAAVGHVLGGVQIEFVVLHAVLSVLGQALRLWRWDQLVRPFTAAPMMTLLRIGSIGNALMLLLPLRLGEFARPWMLRQECGVAATSGMASVAVERTLDGLMVVGFFFASLLLLPGSVAIPPMLHAAAMMALLVFGGAAVVLVLAVLSHDHVCRLIRRAITPVAPSVTERVIGLIDAFALGLKALPSVGAVVGVIVITCAVWSFGALSFWALGDAFGWHLPLISGWFILAVSALSIMIPAGPAFLGPYQLGLTLGLGVFGIDATHAAAYGLLAYPIMLMVTLGYAVPFLLIPSWRRHPRGQVLVSTL